MEIKEITWIKKHRPYEEIGCIVDDMTNMRIASIELDSGRSKEEEDTPYKIILYIPGFKINKHFKTTLEAKNCGRFLLKDCQYKETCSKGDVLSPQRPYDVLFTCDKWPATCKGGGYREIAKNDKEI